MLRCGGYAGLLLGAVMDVFIGNLPPSTTFNEIRWLHGNWNFDAVIERVDGQSMAGHVYQYFIAHFSKGGEEEAGRLIKQLNGMSYFRQKVEVREFIHRSYRNERRAPGWRDRPWHGVERRNVDRRKSIH